MFTKAIARALVIVLTVGMTSLVAPLSTAMTQADSLTISTVTHSQAIGETATPSSPVATVSFLGENRGDTYSVTASLVSAPAGNTRLPVLRLIETTAAIVFTTDSLNHFSQNTVIAANTQARISPRSTGAALISAKFQVYLDSPTVVGTYVVRLTPTVVGGGGVANATGQNITITVGSSTPEPDPTPSPVYSPPTETSTPDTYTAILNITTALPTQITSSNQMSSDLFVNLISTANNLGDTASVQISLISTPAGSTSLPVLELIQTTNARVDDTAQLNGALPNGSVVVNGSGSAYMTAISAPGTMTSRYKLYMNNPKKSGTYVIGLLPRIESGVGTAPTKRLTITLTVTKDPDTYPASGEVVISNPGDITNKSDAVINVSKAVDTSNEVAVIRTTMKSASGLATSLDSYTAVITGVGVIGSAALSNNINTSAVGRAITVKAGDAVTVYADGTAGEGEITISNYDGIVLGRKTVTFVDLTNQASAILALSFSSFPEKGTSMQLTALVNLPGTVRFTSNGKTLGSCARVVATGSPKTAICKWKPPLAGSINVVARFTPTDTQIAAVSTTKALAIGRRSGKR
jgi:hypothetical protein